MTTEFGWWNKDPELGKYQVRALIHGDTIIWERKVGRFTSWLAHEPSEADWDRLVQEAERRVPRRLLSPRQFATIVQLRQRADRR